MIITYLHLIMTRLKVSRVRTQHGIGNNRLKSISYYSSIRYYKLLQIKHTLKMNMLEQFLNQIVIVHEINKHYVSMP